MLVSNLYICLMSSINVCLIKFLTKPGLVDEQTERIIKVFVQCRNFETFPNIDTSMDIEQHIRKLVFIKYVIGEWHI